MATTKTDQVRILLETERERIQNELQQLTNSLVMEGRRDSNPFGKREEEASESLELEKRLAKEIRLKSLLAEVEQALKKLDAGTYGICEMCNLAIDPARMEVLPQAILCISCRQKTKNAKVQFPAG